MQVQQSLFSLSVSLGSDPVCWGRFCGGGPECGPARLPARGRESIWGARQGGEPGWIGPGRNQLARSCHQLPVSFLLLVIRLLLIPSLAHLISRHLSEPKPTSCQMSRLNRRTEHGHEEPILQPTGLQFSDPNQIVLTCRKNPAATRTNSESEHRASNRKHESSCFYLFIYSTEWPTDAFESWFWSTNFFCFSSGVTDHRRRKR